MKKFISVVLLVASYALVFYYDLNLYFSLFLYSSFGINILNDGFIFITGLILPFLMVISIWILYFVLLFTIDYVSNKRSCRIYRIEEELEDEARSYAKRAARCFIKKNLNNFKQTCDEFLSGKTSIQDKLVTKVRQDIYSNLCSIFLEKFYDSIIVRLFAIDSIDDELVNRYHNLLSSLNEREEFKNKDEDEYEDEDENENVLFNKLNYRMYKDIEKYKDPRDIPQELIIKFKQLHKIFDIKDTNETYLGDIILLVDHYAKLLDDILNNRSIEFDTVLPVTFGKKEKVLYQGNDILVQQINKKVLTKYLEENGTNINSYYTNKDGNVFWIYTYYDYFECPVSDYSGAISDEENDAINEVIAVTKNYIHYSNKSIFEKIDLSVVATLIPYSNGVLVNTEGVRRPAYFIRTNEPWFFINVLQCALK